LLRLGHSPALCAITLNGDRQYLTCDRCGDFLTLAPSELDVVRAAIRSQFGYLASFTHFPIVGLCPAAPRTRADDAWPLCATKDSAPLNSPAVDA
jgi:hypothetical protein